MIDPYIFDERMVCHVINLEYDFAQRAGTAYLKPGDVPNMRTTIERFEAIDPEVQNITVLSGWRPGELVTPGNHDTFYQKSGSEWAVRFGAGEGCARPAYPETA